MKFAACNFIKKETLAQAFSCEFCEISNNTFFYRTPLVAASEIIETRTIVILVAQAILILIENWYTISYRNFILKMYLFLKLKPLIKLYVHFNGKCFHQSLVPKLEVFIVRLTSFNWLRLLSSEWFKTPEYNCKSLKYWITATFCELPNPGKKKETDWCITTTPFFANYLFQTSYGQ